MTGVRKGTKTPTSLTSAADIRLSEKRGQGLMDHLTIIAQRTEAALACQVPEKLHPLSANTLAAFLQNNLSEGEFARLFSMADSAYVALTECILDKANAAEMALALLQ